MKSPKHKPSIKNRNSMSKLEKPVNAVISMPDIPSASSTNSVKELRINEEVKKDTLGLRRSSNETGLYNRNVPSIMPPTFSIEDLIAPSYAPVAEYQMKTGAPRHLIR